MPDSFSALDLEFLPAENRVRLANSGGPEASFTLPIFDIEGQAVSEYHLADRGTPETLSNGARQVTWTFQSETFPALSLDLIWRGFAGSPVLRLLFRLRSSQPLRMTKALVGGVPADRITYLSLSTPGIAALSLEEIQLSHFDPVVHSYMPYRRSYRPHEVRDGLAFTGPIAIFHGEGAVLLAAYEHGADHPQGFLGFSLQEEDGQRKISLRARKGNYHHNRILRPGQPFESVWFDLALYPGSLEEFLPVYRRFFLEEVCINPQSRQPYVFYNTWNYQERLKYFEHRPYLSEMNAQRMLAEIDAAHRLGVDVFVIDTGWYGKTGDWLPNLERFPQGLQEIRQRLDAYGMKLGLWFNPTVAALTSQVFRQHPEYERTWQGEPGWRGEVWETEESASMCLVSGFAATFVETMVRLNRELGVTYFKWDGISQYGCDSPLHDHGTAENSSAERADCYAYELGRAMIWIVEEVSRRCPDVIVDFDVTEGGRFVGLGFLSVGKYFLINNGPYFHDFDIPHSVRIDPDTINAFFYPGPARPRICRQGIQYDPIIPSILFLTHYLPYEPRLAQENSLASLVLGGSGWWGDLPSLSEDSFGYLGGQIALYKRVAWAVTRACPRLTGFAGSSPEIYEKIIPAESAGLVAFFTVTPARVVYHTQPIDPQKLDSVVGADAWELLPDNCLRLEVDLPANGARVVYLLASS